MIVLYIPSLDHGFVNWDDPLYVYENPDIDDLNLNSIAKLFITEVVGNWHPLTMLSLQLDYQVWGSSPRGFHLTNVALHTLNCLLVFFVTLRLVRSLNIVTNHSSRNATAIAAISAILFGVHPIHVESVAWISERKDLLYSFFYLISIALYIRFTTVQKNRKWLFYCLSLVLFGFSLMSKPMAVTLPLVLLIIDVYPLRRLSILSRSRSTAAVLLEKTPYLMLSLLSSVVTIWAQQSGGAIKSVTAIPVLTRFAVAVRAYIFYIIKIILPLDLAPFYPHPAISEINIPTIHYAAYFAVFLGITIVCIWTLRKSLVFMALWLFYLVTLAPVIGIIHIGGHAAADRYMYIASIAPFLLIGLGVAAWINKITRIRYRAMLITVLLLFTALYFIQARKQISIWQDSITLWSYEISIFPDAEALPYYNRGKAWDEMGKPMLAMKDYDRAIAINSYHTAAYNSRGIILGKVGEYEKAIWDFSKAIELDPDWEKAYSNRGIVYHHLKQYNLAMQDYLKAIELNPSDPISYYNIASLYSELGNPGMAATYRNKARELSSTDSK